MKKPFQYRYQFKFASGDRDTITVRAPDQKSARAKAKKDLIKRYKERRWPVPVQWILEIISTDDPIWR